MMIKILNLLLPEGTSIVVGPAMISNEAIAASINVASIEGRSQPLTCGRCRCNGPVEESIRRRAAYRRGIKSLGSIFLYLSVPAISRRLVATGS